MKRPSDTVKQDISLLGMMLALIVLLAAEGASAGLINTFNHTYGFDADPNAVQIDLRVYDEQPGGKYLWEYTVTNNSYNPSPGVSNGFSGFELFLPTPIPEISDITPNPGTTPAWEVNCCSGNPVEWDIRNSDGMGVMPGENMIFSFLTDPRLVAINNDGWFHSWEGDIQTDIVTTLGMHVPLVPGLTPVDPQPPSSVPEPATLSLLGFGLALVLRSRRRRAGSAFQAV